MRRKVNGTMDNVKQKIDPALTVILIVLMFITVACKKNTASETRIASLVITPVKARIVAGYTQQFKAVGTYTNNVTSDLTTSVTWSSSDGTVLAIDSTGFATTFSSGTTTISANMGTYTASQTVAVISAVPQDPDDLLYSLYAGLDILGLDTAKVSQIFSLARSDLQLQYLKVNFRWNEIQPNDASSWDWTVPDEVAAYAAANNLSIIAFFPQADTPVWAQKTPPAGIDVTACSQGVSYITKDPGYYANFISQFMIRYKDSMSIHTIELENEPNCVCNWPDTAQYLATVDNTVITQVRGIDTTIRICSASFHQPLGLPYDSSGMPTNLAADNMYSTQFLYDYLSYLDPTIDCFSLHDYGRIGFTETDATYPFSSQYDLEQNYRSVLDQYGFTKTGLTFTECAYDISKFNNDDMFTTAQLLQGYILNHTKDIAEGRMCQAISTGTLKDTVDYGITDLTGSTPVYRAGYYGFQTMRNMMRSYPTYVQHVAGLLNDDGYWVEQFADSTGSKTLYVAFVPIRFDTAKGLPYSTPPADQIATVRIGTGKKALVTSMLGVQTPVSADTSGDLVIDVGAGLSFIEIL